MKLSAGLFLLLILSFSISGWSQSPVAEDFSKLSWLEGTWTRTNITKPGRSAHERWEKLNPNEFRGYGVNMQGQDTVFLEKISIVIKDNALYYVADVPENKQPVLFKFTSITTNGFVCENPDHDFPKKIIYRLEEKKLKAQISGNGKVVDYWFEKQ